MLTNLSQRLCRSGSCLVLIIGILCALVTVVGQGAELSDRSGSTFYENSKEGWFWYEDPAQETEGVHEDVKSVRPSIEQGARENKYRNISFEEYGLHELWEMYPDDFQELLNHVQNLAVQQPSEKNVLRYLVMQDVARRKALAYTNSSMYVTQKYGNLFNVNQVYPTAKPGVTARVEMQQQEIELAIGKGRNSYALIYFTSPACGFCRKQDSILHYFIEKYGWQVKPVDISRQVVTAARFGIETTPTLLLIKKGMDDYMTVSVGVVTLTELERKLYRAIRYLKGETRDENFLMYDFQKDSAFDPTSIFSKKDEQPWQRK